MIDTMKSKDPGALTFPTFQEHTSIPVTVREAVISASDPPADFLTKTIALLNLRVANEAVNKSVASKVRLSLPVGASVKRFELMRDEQWYPATPVPKKQSKEIVHMERRSVETWGLCQTLDLDVMSLRSKFLLCSTVLQSISVWK